MAEGEQMQKVDLSKDKIKINAATQDWMKFIEKENLLRVEKLQKIRSKNRITALFLGTTVISIYAYSILAVKQETFLDDFEEPKVVIKEENTKLV